MDKTENKESSQQKRTCTLSDEELWIRCDRWVSKLAESGGRDWVLRVPPDYDNDPDMLFLELLQRFAATFVKAKLTPSDPNDSWQNEGDENVYTETGHPGF